MDLIYGVGKIGKDFLKECRSKNLVSIRVCDKNQALHGTEYMGYIIENPEEIKFDEINRVIVTTSEEIYDEIVCSLQEKVKDVADILHYSKVIILTDYEFLNVGNLRFKEKIENGIYTHLEIIDFFDETSFNDFDKFIYKTKHKEIYKWVHYTEIYNRFFEKYRDRNVRILEIGVFNGGSLQMWKNYFAIPGAEVECFGIDIDPSCKSLEENGIKIFIGSQEDRDFLKQIKKQIGKVDIIIDDGGHTMNQQIVSFEELFEMLVEDGVYLCEDTHTSYMEEIYGGGYKKENTFIEYSKNLIDGINKQYIKNYDEIKSCKKYMDEIKSVSYFDSVVVIEKKRQTIRSFALQI